MNKKTLFLILLLAVLVLPITANALEAKDIAIKVKNAALQVGIPLVIVGWVIAGIIYLTSAGGARLELGKKAIFAAVLGTVLVILAASACDFINTLFGLGGSCR